MNCSKSCVSELQFASFVNQYLWLPVQLQYNRTTNVNKHLDYKSRASTMSNWSLNTDQSISADGEQGDKWWRHKI